jgi:hypothetical protein
MRFFDLVTGLLVWLNVALANDNGLQKVVTWDNGSLLINGERIIIMSGEFHYQRLPVPELWLDVFQKFKANGMNAVSICKDPISDIGPISYADRTLSILQTSSGATIRRQKADMTSQRQPRIFNAYLTWPKRPAYT